MRSTTASKWALSSRNRAARGKRIPQARVLRQTGGKENAVPKPSMVLQVACNSALRTAPSHYRLLGLALFEADPDVLANAADKQMATSGRSKRPTFCPLSEDLNEIAAARICLLNAAKKASTTKSCASNWPLWKANRPDSILRSGGSRTDLQPRNLFLLQATAPSFRKEVALQLPPPLQQDY